LAAILNACIWGAVSTPVDSLGKNKWVIESPTCYYKVADG